MTQLPQAVRRLLNKLNERLDEIDYYLSLDAEPPRELRDIVGGLMDELTETYPGIEDTPEGRAVSERINNQLNPPPEEDPAPADGSGKSRRGRGKSIKMPHAQFVKEHKKLVKVLESGTPAERRKEAQEQRAELKARGGKAPWRYANKAPAFFDYK
jgi:hypothetical protein